MAIQTIAAVPVEEQLASFRPKVRFRVEAGDYLIKTVETQEELRKVLRLRYECFIREWKLGNEPDGLDFDSYDLAADHVAVTDPQSGKVMATYRLLCNKTVDNFYSQNEFDLSGFLASPGTKLELGRACVDSSHRDGSAIGMVWRGVTRYIQEVGADYLFGCSPVQTTSPDEAMGVLDILRPKYFSEEFRIAPTPAYSYDWDQLSKTNAPAGTYEALIPGLLKSYLLSGAKIHGLPALDRDFRCTDFFTILAMKDIHPRMRQRYFTSKAS